MNKYTAGPWKFTFESVDQEWAIITDVNGNIIANVNSETGPDIPPLVSTKMPAISNARLIALAPEMLELINYMYKQCRASGHVDQEPHMQRAREIMAKADC